MLERRGEGRNSVIRGSSVHNQRVERLWRDVYRVVMQQYKNLFYYLEQHRLLDPLNESDLYALHYVYLPRINRALSEFQHQHNYHPLRTEHNLTPMQLFELSPRSPEADRVNSMFGVEDEGPFPDLESENCVYVPPVSVNLSPTGEAAVFQIDPLSNDANWHGINLYCSVLWKEKTACCLVMARRTTLLTFNSGGTSNIKIVLCRSPPVNLVILHLHEMFQKELYADVTLMKGCRCMSILVVS